MGRFLRLKLRQIVLIATILLTAQVAVKADVVRRLDNPLNIFTNIENPFVTARLVMCYPNPATSYINFKFDNTVPFSSTLSIYSFTGRKMAVLAVNDNSIIRISLDNYFRGLYVYQLCDQNGNILESGRFLVKN